MQADDPVCYYMAEAVKPGAEARFEQAGKAELFKAVHAVLDTMSQRCSRIRRTLERAKETGSRMVTIFRLAEKSNGAAAPADAELTGSAQ